jgi:hypothetical protein
VADTKDNRPYDRRRANIRFFAGGDLAIPRRAGAQWLVVDRNRFELDLPLEEVYSDERFTLYHLSE